MTEEQTRKRWGTNCYDCGAFMSYNLPVIGPQHDRKCDLWWHKYLTPEQADRAFGARGWANQ